MIFTKGFMGKIKKHKNFINSFEDLGDEDSYSEEENIPHFEFDKKLGFFDF